MSNKPPPPCPKCAVPLTFERVAPFAAGDESMFAAAWLCPSCGERALDVCPVGPVSPIDGTCLNCGDAVPPDARCAGCGMDSAETRAFFGLTDDKLATIDRARADFTGGLHRRGLARLNRLLALDPGHADAWAMKGSFYAALGFHSAAAAALRQGADASGDAALLVSAGVSLQSADRHAEAVALYRDFLGRAPESPHTAIAWCNLANSLSRLDNDDAADAAYRAAVGREPERATHYYNHYTHLRKLRCWPEALSVLEAGLPRAADTAQRLLFLRAVSFVHAECDEGEPALAAAEAAIALDEHSVGARYLRGRGLALIGRLGEAMAEMRRVLQLDPNNADAKNAIAMLERAGLGARPRPWWRFWG